MTVISFNSINKRCCLNCTTTPITGYNFSVADAFTGNPNEGTHFHSGTGLTHPHGAPPVPSIPTAEVGGFFGDEAIRGQIEFDLSSIPIGIISEVTLKINVAADPVGGGGLNGQPPYIGNIDIYSYVGNGVGDVSDYELPTNIIGSLNTSGLTPGSAVPDISVPVGLVAGAFLGIQLRMNAGDPQANFLDLGNPITSILTSAGTITLNGGTGYTMPGDLAAMQAEIDAYLASNGGGTSTVIYDGGQFKTSIIISGAIITFISVSTAFDTYLFDTEDNFSGAIVFDNTSLEVEVCQ